MESQVLEKGIGAAFELEKEISYMKQVRYLLESILKQKDEMNDRYQLYITEWNDAIRKRNSELQKLYTEIGILPEYRGFLTIGYMNQLISDGYSGILEGLYDIVESELSPCDIAKGIDRNQRLIEVSGDIRRKAEEKAELIYAELAQSMNN